ncbi:MAG: hypothetical protein K0M40_09280 [Prolixibacteraceae bacterium]|nr:hypothetical protein [Prolixibacteraceae bacterium]
MKNTFALLGMGLATFLLSSPVIAQNTKETKETRHIKMTKIENGKKMELDTVLTGNDVFIWNGDTIGPAKHIKKFSPSGFDKMHNIDVKVDRRDGKEMIFTDEENMKHFPPMPPMPPMPHIKMMRGGNSGRVIDLNDPNIISFKKKNLSGNREKIEIIREKSQEPENLTFDFEVDDEPMAPEAPESIREFDDNNRKMRITEKKIELNDKKEKEIKVEVVAEENK